jgi:hypothetical protein
MTFEGVVYILQQIIQIFECEGRQYSENIVVEWLLSRQHAVYL